MEEERAWRALARCCSAWHLASREKREALPSLPDAVRAIQRSLSAALVSAVVAGKDHDKFSGCSPKKEARENSPRMCKGRLATHTACRVALQWLLRVLSLHPSHHSESGPEEQPDQHSWTGGRGRAKAISGLTLRRLQLSHALTILFCLFFAAALSP